MIAVASLIVLIAVIAFSAVTKKNAGVVGLVAAYIFSGKMRHRNQCLKSRDRKLADERILYRPRHHIPLWYCNLKRHHAGTFQEHRMSRKRKREDPAGDLLSLRRDHLRGRRRRTNRRSHHADCPVRRS